jgi:orotate phosphoribosyltransferase
VRKAVKDHGTKKRIDGTDSLAGKNVAILEDVTTTGGSAIQAVEVVREAGANVVLVLSIVDRLEGAAEAFAAAKVPFDSLFTRDDFMKD